MDDEAAYQSGLLDSLDGETVSLAGLLICAEKYEAAKAYTRGWLTGQQVLWDADVSVLEGEVIEHE